MIWRNRHLATAFALSVAVAALPGLGAPLARPGLTPEIGSSLDLGLAFRNAAGRQDSLGGFMAGRPTLLLLGYNRCTNLCGIVQGELARALADSGLAPDAYATIFASIDPAETPDDAARARAGLAAEVPPAALSSWHFLTGTPADVTALRQQVGLDIAQRPNSTLFVHPVAVIALTPQGRISRVMPGSGFAPRDIRLAIVDASDGRLGTLGERILLLCSAFDPTTGRYSAGVLAGIRLAGLAALAVLAGCIALLLRRERRR